MGFDQEPVTLDPHGNALATTYSITSSIGESLLYADEHGDLKPWLAESWEIGDGGATYTFKLRHDVVFQDGTPFNAAAVKWNFDRIVAPSFKAGAALGQLTGYQGTEIVDDFIARVRFSQPFVPFLTYAGRAVLLMLSPTATSRADSDVTRAPVTTGPFKVEEWVAHDHVTLARWDGYTRRSPWSDHEGAPFLEKVVWKFVPDAGVRMAALESGELQAATVVTPQNLARSVEHGMSAAATPWGGAALNLYLNVMRPPTDDVRVRQAIAAALDPEALLSTIYLGARAIGPLVANLLQDPTLQATRRSGTDVLTAARLLDEAGWMAGSDGIRSRNGQRLELVLNAVADVALSSGGGPYQLIQAQLRQVGIDVNIREQTGAAWQEDNYRCATNAALTRLTTNELDVLHSLFHSSKVGGNYNYSCFKNAEVDSLLDQGRREIDPARRKQIYLEVERQLVNSAVVIPLLDQPNTYVLRPEVQGMRFTGSSYPALTDVVFR